MEDLGLNASASKAASLRVRLLRAGGWTLSGHFIGLLFRLVSNLIMSRLLAPELFGIMAISSVIQIVTALLSDIGLRQAIVQHARAEDPSFRNSAWTLQVVRGCWIWAICLLAAGGLRLANLGGLLPATSVYAASGLPAVVAVSSFSSVISGLQSMKALMQTRNIDLKRITLIELSAQIIALLVAIPLAFYTHSIWAFVASGLISSAVTTLLSHFWLYGPRDRLEWNSEEIREIVHFGKWIFLTSALAVLASNADRLLLGVWLGPAELGYYSIALNLASVADGLADRLFTNVAFPLFSEVARNRPSEVSIVYLRGRLLSDSLLLATAGFLFAAGRSIVGILYDPRYAEVGQILQILSFGLVFTRFNLAHTLYISLGRPDYVTIISMTKFVSLLMFVPALFYAFGFYGAIAGVAFHMLPCALIVFFYDYKHDFHRTLFEGGIALIWPLGWLIGHAFSALVTSLKI